MRENVCYMRLWCAGFVGSDLYNDSSGDQEKQTISHSAFRRRARLVAF